ncbi:FAD-binding oxidoreductase [Candidatus Saccharibacteria bacterium]|nr:FAD-binding oxidoreductase [Candidatus Saccharibacteria bacterium]
MLKLPNDELSYWKNSVSGPSYEQIQEDLSVDVVIVGGGITGLTAAHLLKQSGQKVAVLEKNTIGSGTSSKTTGKVTSQHGLTYTDLSKHHGKKTARIYGEANQTALERIEQLIHKEKIDCDWQRDDNFVFTADPQQLAKFKKEAALAAGLGLPASFETRLTLPFKVKGAVKFANQAKFHIQKYMQGLAAAVNGQGSYVFERSNAVGMRDGTPGKVRTKHADVIAKDIIIASKIPAFPLIARGAYAALEYPHTSYIVAAPLEKSLTGMYISPDEDHYSILPVEMGAERLLLIGGQNHIPGLGSPTRRHQQLADYAEKHFGAKSISYRWKGMDYLAYDDIPLIGKLYPWSSHMYVATGFKKWGLSTSMVAGTILHDLITKQANPWAPVFNSMRLKPVMSIPRVIAKELTK